MMQWSRKHEATPLHLLTFCLRVGLYELNVSVIIASRNEGPNLIRTVRSTVESAPTLALDIVIVDDGSIDTSIRDVRDAYPNISVVRHECSLGVSPSRVSGAAAAKGDVLIFLDAHVKPELHCLQRLVDGIAATQGNAVLIPMVTQFDTVTWRSDESLRGFGYELSLDACKGRWLELSEMRSTVLGTTTYYESPTVVGCSVAVHRDAYEHLMGFDPLMRTWGMEDVDFGIRAWMTGHPVLCDPVARLGHRFVTEFVSFEGRLVDMGANQIKMAHKVLGDFAFREWLSMRGLGAAGVASDSDSSRFWKQAWIQFEEDLARSKEAETEFKSRRLIDEYAYALRFGLKWPICASLQRANA